MPRRSEAAVGRSLPAAGLALLLLAEAAAGIEFHYATPRPAALEPCDRQLYRGQRDEARACYAGLLATVDDVRLRAEAARGLGDVQSANRYFQQAVEESPDDAALLSRWGELFLSTHQDGEAARLFQESLELDEDHLPAKLGLARVSAQRFEQRARGWAGEVLAARPEALAAHLLLARMDLEEGAIERADRRLDDALEIAERNDWPPLEIYALKASVDLLNGVTESEWTGRALEYNAAYGEIYSIPAHFYVITRRYREAVELLQRAIEVQPDLYSAHAELGINLLRENEVEAAQRHLAIAYRGDPYSAQIVNTLRLIDSFENFVVRHVEPRSGEGAGMILRLHESEAAVLEPYVTDLVGRSIETFSERYGFEPERPVVVELYPEHDDFAVRTSGLPGIGLLGVAFGYLVAIDSPSGRPPGDFHWGTTLWHEMAHVFTLEATNHLVPRWFSEGVSVYEEWHTGPLPGRHVPRTVLQAMQEDKFLPVAELDGGFIRPSYESQIVVSYMQAGLLCEYIAERWGQRGLVGMLELFAEGRSTSEAIEGALNVPPDVLDAAFAEHIEAEFGAVLDVLDAWQRHNQAAHEAARRSEWQQAADAAAAAIELYPEYVAEASPYLVQARAYDSLGQRDAAIAALAAYHGHGGHQPAALNRLAGWFEEAGRAREALAVLSDIIWVAPLDDGLHAQLGDWLLRDDRPEDALAEYEILLAMDPHDRASAHYRLARAYAALEDTARSREHLLYALEIAPHYREAQQLLLEIVR